MTKQGNAFRTLTFSALTFSLVGAMSAHAQLIELDPPAEGAATAPSAPSAAEAAPAQVSATPSAATRPVTVSQAMVVEPVPTAAPAALMAPPVQQVTRPVAVESLTAPSVTTGANTSPALPTAASNNTNGQGTQINLNIKSDLDSRQDQALTSDTNRLDSLRMEKKVREKVNEERLAEKIEEDRISGEKVRTTGIEKFNFAGNSPSGNAQNGSVQAVPVLAMADNSPTAAPFATVSSVETTAAGSGGWMQDMRFKITPNVGYRWLRGSSNTLYGAQGISYGSSYTAGIGLEGQINRYLGIETSFAYSRDNFNLPGMGGYGYGGMGGGYGYGGVGGGYGSIGGMGGYNGYMFQNRDDFDVGINGKFGYEMNSGFRPYVLAGVGGLYQHYNIDNQYTVVQAGSDGYQRSSAYFTGTLGLGMDYSFGKNFGAGLRLSYESVLTSAAPSQFDAIWGDTASRVGLTGNLQLLF